MKYILDFDDCLCNTKRLKEIIEVHGLADHPRNLALLDALAECEPDLNFTDLLYPDAKEFLINHPGQWEILSSACSEKTEQNDDLYAAAEFQKEKIKRVLGDLYEAELVHITYETKSENLARYQVEWTEPFVFVDDKEMHAKEGWALQVPTILIRRQSGQFKSMEGLGTIRSFDNLDHCAEALYRESVIDEQTAKV